MAVCTGRAFIPFLTVSGFKEGQCVHCLMFQPKALGMKEISSMVNSTAKEPWCSQAVGMKQLGRMGR